MNKHRAYIIAILSFNIAANAGTVLVADKSRGNVHLLDKETFVERARIEVGKYPHEVVCSPQGDIALVSHYGALHSKPGNKISIIDVAEGKKTGEIELPQGARPHGMVFINEEEALVTTEGQQTLTLVRTKDKSASVLLSLTGKGAHMVILGKDGSSAFVTNNQSGSVLKVDLESAKIVAEVNLGRAAEGMAISEKGDRLIVGNRKDNEVSQLDTEDLSIIWQTKTSWGPIRMILFDDDRYAAVTSVLGAQVDIIDWETGEVINQFSPVAKRSLLPVPITITTYAKNQALVAVSKASHLSLVDLKNNNIIRRIDVGKEPDGMAISSVDVGSDSSLVHEMRKIERAQCSILRKGKCYDSEGFPQNLIQSAYQVMDASREQVWRIITDLPAFGEWNPFMVKAESTLQPGDPLSFKVKLTASVPFYETVTILTRKEFDSICWGSEILGGGLRTKRCFNLVDLPGGRTLYYTQERFQGILAAATVKAVGLAIKKGINAEAEELKKRAEGI